MFSWSSSSTAAAYPGQRLQQQRATNAIEGTIRPPSSSITRAQHLQSYLEDSTLQRSTRRISSDDTTYDTVFQTTKGDTLILRVNMPLESSFCTSCPVMSLAGVRVRHPWISDRHSRVTGYDPIQSENVWVSSGITLGEAVHAVVKHLQLNPPEILEIMDKGLLAIQTKKQQPSSSKQKASQLKNGNPRNERSARADAPPSYNVFANLPEAPDIPMPAIPKSYPILDDLSREELDRLMEDELEFLSLVHKVEAFHQIQSIRNEKLDDNVTLAKANLENESQLKAAQEEVGKLQKTLKEKVSSFQQLESKQNALCAPPDTQSVIRQLNKASQQAMDDSEALAEDWVENGGDVAKFFKDFIAQRKVYHVREAKMERLQRQNIKEI